MKKNKINFKLAHVIVIFLIAIAFNLLVFLLKTKNYTPTFWLIYGFAMFGFVAVLFTALYVKDKVTGVASIQPLLTVALMYWMVSLVFAFIFIWFHKINIKIILVPVIFITVIFSVAYVYSLMNKRLIQRDNRPKPVIRNILDVQDTLTNLKSMTNDQALVASIDELIVLAEISSDNLDVDEALDKRLFEYVKFLYRNIDRNDNNAMTNIEKIKQALKERNK